MKESKHVWMNHKFVAEYGAEMNENWLSIFLIKSVFCLAKYLYGNKIFLKKSTANCTKALLFWAKMYAKVIIS
jgi:hypothetical protein